MKTDYQQSRAYKWENAQAWSQKGTKTLEVYELKYLNKRLNKLFGLKTQLQDKHANGVCHYNSYNDAIYLAGYGFNWSVYLHEYAHALTVQHKPAHGKEFVSAFCALLHFVHPDKPSISELAKSANSFDLDFVSLTENIWYKKLSRSKIDISKAIKPKEKIIEPKKSLNQVHKNYQKLLARQENLLKKQKQYKSNLKRVANSLKKVEKSIVQYEKKYDEEKLTSKYQEPIVRKMPPKKDWQAMALDLAERYEGIKIGYDYYGNCKEIDLWYHGNRPPEWEYERSGQFPCMPRYSWRMIYNLAVETLQDDGVWND